VVFFPIMFVFILCVFCSIVIFRLLFLMFMHIRLICTLIKITYLITYLLYRKRCSDRQQTSVTVETAEMYCWSKVWASEWV